MLWVTSEFSMSRLTYLSSASHMVKLSSRPTALEYIRKYLTQIEWNVPICNAVVRLSPIRLTRRSRISFAALLVKVTAHIEAGATSWTRIRYAILEVRTWPAIQSVARGKVEKKVPSFSHCQDQRVFAAVSRGRVLQLMLKSVSTLRLARSRLSTETLSRIQAF